MDDAKLSGLQAAIAKATIEVGGFIADKRNNDQNYFYISADAVLERGGIALAKVGVSVIPAVTSWDVKFVPRQGKSDRIDALVNFEMTVLCGDEKFTAPWAGCGSDYSTPDKALYKAITSGHKYFLMKLLNIGVGNSDSEHDDDEEQPRKSTAQSRTTAAPVVNIPAANAPEVVKNAAQSSEMTIEEAEAVENARGVKYGAIETPTLAHMVNEMAKLNKPEHETKIKAARMIMAARGGGRPVQQA